MLTSIVIPHDRDLLRSALRLLGNAKTTGWDVVIPRQANLEEFKTPWATCQAISDPWLLRQAVRACLRSGSPGDRIVQAEVPDCGQPGAKEVRDQIVHVEGIVEEREHDPIDEQATGIDGDI